MRKTRNLLLDYNWKKKEEARYDKELFWDTLFIAAFIALVFVGWGATCMGGAL